jgi:hypothetical protein
MTESTSELRAPEGDSNPRAFLQKQLVKCAFSISALLRELSLLGIRAVVLRDVTVPEARRTCDLWVMSYAPGIFPCPHDLKSAGQRAFDISSVSSRRPHFGQFRGLLFPNLTTSEWRD